MKTKILYTIILLVSILSLTLKAQATQEELRAKFLTNYYNEYYNKSSLNNDFESIDSNITLDNIIEENLKNQRPSSLIELRNIETIKANCLSSLQNKNKGVVESAIFVSMQFLNKFPNENGSFLIHALTEIATEYDNTQIGYKAQLAKMYIQNKDWFENIILTSVKDEQEIYAEIAQTLNGKMLTKGL